MDFPPELNCMVKSSLTNRDLFLIDLTCRYLFWCSLSNKEQQLRKCKLWNKSPSKIISDFKNAANYCSHVICWKYRSKYLSLKDIKYLNHFALRWAAKNGHLPVVQYLCEKFQLTLEDVRTWNNEALRCAAFNGHLPVVQYLCEYRDRQNRQLTIQDVRSEHNWALRWSARFGHLPTVQYLCETFSITIQDVRSRDNEALRCAAFNGHLPVVQYLRQRYNIVE
jgi:ankyrin repeat protein